MFPVSVSGAYSRRREPYGSIRVFNNVGQELKCSALTLFVLGVLADDHHFAFPLDDLAFFAHGFYGRSYFHFWYLLLLLASPDNTAAGDIIG